MATAKSLPANTGPELNKPELRKAADATRQNGGGGALVAVSPDAGDRCDSALVYGPVAQIPVQLDVAIPVREFRVRNLLALEPGQVIETRWANGEDLPLAAGQVQLAWSEFEVQENELAVRITRLA